MYQIGDKVVHPMHGAGVIDSIVRKKVAGKVQDYYLLKLSTGSMMVMIPTEHSDEIGVRPVRRPPIFSRRWRTFRWT